MSWWSAMNVLRRVIWGFNCFATWLVTFPKCLKHAFLFLLKNTNSATLYSTSTHHTQTITHTHTHFPKQHTGTLTVNAQVGQTSGVVATTCQCLAFRRTPLRTEGGTRDGNTGRSTEKQGPHIGRTDVHYCVVLPSMIHTWSSSKEHSFLPAACFQSCVWFKGNIASESNKAKRKIQHIKLKVTCILKIYVPWIKPANIKFYICSKVPWQHIVTNTSFLLGANHFLSRACFDVSPREV